MIFGASVSGTRMKRISSGAATSTAVNEVSHSRCSPLPAVVWACAAPKPASVSKVKKILFMLGTVLMR